MAKSLNEAAGKIYMGKNLRPILDDDSLLLENQLKRKELEDANNLLVEVEKAKQKEIEAKLEKLEILPLGSRIILLPYLRNPYRKIVSDGGILIDYDGSFTNPDSGEQDKLPQGIVCGKVIEIGPECKWVKPGDDIYYDSRTTLPIPFYSQGYHTLAEQQVLCVLNEELKKRFKMNE